MPERRLFHRIALALAVILFDSGFGTPLSRLSGRRQRPAIVLATFGVVVTARPVRASPPTIFLTGLGWMESVSARRQPSASTDAAAVFFLLRIGGIN